MSEIPAGAPADHELPEAIELETWPAWHDWLHRTCDVLQTIALMLIAIALIARL